MALPTFYRRYGEGAIASYDGYDYAQGIGYKDFYGLMLASGALVTTTLYSDKIDLVADSLASTGHKGTLLFTTEFQRPCIIHGTGYVNIPLGVAASGSGTISAFASCALTHVSGSTSTTLGTGSTGTLSTTSGDKAFIQSVSIDIAKTKIKVGDYIKLKVELIVPSVTGGGADKAAIAHDPKGRTPTSSNSTDAMDWSTGALSTLILSLPFQLDL